MSFFDTVGSGELFGVSASLSPSGKLQPGGVMSVRGPIKRAIQADVRSLAVRGNRATIFGLITASSAVPPSMESVGNTITLAVEDNGTPGAEVDRLAVSFAPGSPPLACGPPAISIGTAIGTGDIVVIDVPGSTPGCVEGLGRFAVTNSAFAFRVTYRAGAERPTVALGYGALGSNRFLVSTRVTSLVITGTTARIAGEGWTNGGKTVHTRPS